MSNQQPVDYTAIFEHIQNISDKLHSIDITLAKLEKEVAYHVRRSDQLESQQETLRNIVDRIKDENTKMRTGVSLVGWLVALAISYFK